MNLRPYVLLFGGLTVIYHSNFRPIPSGDSLCTSLIPLAVLLDHTVTLDRFAPWLLKNVSYAHDVIRFSHGHYYSGHPIGTGLLVTPLYLPLLAFPNLRHWDPGSLVALARILEKFAATTVAALSAVVVLLLLQRLTSAYWAWRLTFVYALCTATWSIASQALWQHTTGELAIAGALLSLERRSFWMCGVCAAAALMIRPSNVILLPALGLALLLARATINDWTRWLAAPVVVGLAVLAYNYSLFRHATGTYEFPMWAGSVVTGLTGLLFSPGRGLLIYMPIVLFALFALAPAAAETRRKHAPLLTAAIVFAALHSIVMSRVTLWWGGYCWGPRYLTELLPIAVICMAIATPMLERPWIKRAFVAVAAYCLLIQAIGVYFYPKGHWDHTPVPIDNAGGRAWDWKDNPIGRTVAAGPTWEPYVIVGAALTGGTSAAQRKMEELGIHLY